LGWTEHNKWYYGCRYAKKSDPSELWVKYKTSSLHIKRFVAKHGDPNVIQIRRLFNDPWKCILYEQKVLRRLDVEHDKRFLNAKNSTTATVHLEPNSGSFKKGLIPYNKGKKYEMTK